MFFKPDFKVFCHVFLEISLGFVCLVNDGFTKEITQPNTMIHPDDLVGEATHRDGTSGYLLFRDSNGMVTFVLFKQGRVFFTPDGFPEDQTGGHPIHMIASPQLRFVEVKEVTKTEIKFDDRLDYWATVQTMGQGTFDQQTASRWIHASFERLTNSERLTLQVTEDFGGLTLKGSGYTIHFNFPKTFLEKNGKASLEEYLVKFSGGYLRLFAHLSRLEREQQRAIDELERRSGSENLSDVIHRLGIPDPSQDLPRPWDKAEGDFHKLLSLHPDLWLELYNAQAQFLVAFNEKKNIDLLNDISLFSNLYALKLRLTQGRDARLNNYHNEGISALGFENFEEIQSGFKRNSRPVDSEPVTATVRLSDGRIGHGHLARHDRLKAFVPDQEDVFWPIHFDQPRNWPARVINLCFPKDQAVGLVDWRWEYDVSTSPDKDFIIYVPIHDMGQKSQVIERTFRRVFPGYDFSQKSSVNFFYEASKRDSIHPYTVEAFIHLLDKQSLSHIRVFQIRGDRFFLILMPDAPRLFLVGYQEEETIQHITDEHVLQLMKTHGVKVPERWKDVEDGYKVMETRSLLINSLGQVKRQLKMTDFLLREDELRSKVHHIFGRILTTSDLNAFGAGTELSGLAYVLTEMCMQEGWFSWHRSAFSRSGVGVLELPIDLMRVEDTAVGGFERIDMLTLGQRIQVEIPHHAVMTKGRKYGHLLRPGFLHEGDGRWAHLCQTQFCLGRGDILDHTDALVNSIFRSVGYITSIQVNLQIRSEGHHPEEMPTRDEPWLASLKIPEQFRDTGPSEGLATERLIGIRGPMQRQTDILFRLGVLRRSMGLGIADKIRLLASVSLSGDPKYRSYTGMEVLFFPEPSFQGLASGDVARYASIIETGYRTYMEGMGLTPAAFDYAFGEAGGPKPSCEGLSIFQRMLRTP